MLPLGTTINMDGTAIFQVKRWASAGPVQYQPTNFQAIAAVFMAQYSGQPLDIGDIILIGTNYKLWLARQRQTTI